MTQATEPRRMTLADGFEPRTRADWQRLVADVLDKRRTDGGHTEPDAAEQALVTALDGGLTTHGLYLREDRPLGLPGRMPFTRGRTVRDPDRPWDVRQLHDDPDATRTRTAVLDDLEHGATSVWVHVGDDGLAASDLPNVLADVHLDLAPLAVTATTDQPSAARTLLDLVGDRPSAGVELGLDPVGAALRTGAPPDLDPLTALVRRCAGRADHRAVTVDARVLHDAGASEVDALAVAVATGVAYLRRLTDDGVDVGEAFRHLQFRVAATADQFLTAAALRALRTVWARVGEACGVPEAERGARTHAVTSLRMLSREDPFVNVLRNTLAVFGAATGGADVVTVLPHDTVAGLPERFSRRLARNTQLLLADEAHVGRVTDPGGGSWYLESLTDDVAARVWDRFQELERAGGVVAALDAGLLRSWVDDAVAARDPLLATRRRAMTGTSTFPDLAAAVPERRPRRQVEADPGAFTPHRDAAAFEALRERARALGSPAVTVRTIGTQREHAARLGFVTTVLAAGGLATTEAPTPVAVLAGSRGGYAEHGRAAADELRAAGAERVVVAGRAAELGDDARAVDGELYDGVDVVAVLDDVLDRLERAGAAEETP